MPRSAGPGRCGSTRRWPTRRSSDRPSRRPPRRG
jgi:hypothetical protein